MRRFLPLLKTILSTPQWLLLILVAIGFYIFLPSFRSVDNLITVVFMVSYLGMMALGEAVVVISGGFDLSVGAMNTYLAGVVFGASWVHFNLPWAVGFTLCLLAGVIAGVINGLLITKLKLNAFLTTFAMAGAILGAGKLIAVATGTDYTGLKDPVFSLLGSGRLGPIPVPVIVFIVLGILFYYLTTKTTFGTSIYAVGNNEIAARISGINVDRIRIITYAMCGFLASFARLVEISHETQSMMIMSDIPGFEPIVIQIIGAVFIGGISVLGGSGKISGLIAGILIIGVVSNGLEILSGGTIYIMLAVGLLIIISAALDPSIQRRFRGRIRIRGS